MSGEMREKALGSGGADRAGKHVAARETSLEHVLPELRAMCKNRQHETDPN